MTASSVAKLCVLTCSLLSGACTLHVTTGPSSTALRGGYAPASPQVVRSVPRPRRAQPAEVAVHGGTSRQAPRPSGDLPRPSGDAPRPSGDAPPRVDRSLGAERNLASSGSDERVPPFVTSSHTSRPKRSLAAGGQPGRAEGTGRVSVRERVQVKDALPDRDGRHQRLAQRHDADAQPAGPSDE